MKNLSLLAGLIGCLLISTEVNAQNDGVTSKTATKGKGYVVLNKEGTITFYKYVNRAHSPKETDKYAPKYFFTTAASDVLLPLTKDNIKKSFPENHPFHDALDATIRSDNELTMYDSF